METFYRMQRLFLIGIVALALGACVPAATPLPAETLRPTASPVPSATFTRVPPSATPLPSATAAPASTATPEATATFTPIPPTDTPAPTATNTPKPTAAGPANYAPAVASVWNTTIGPDNMTGTCAGSVTPAYGLLQITPSGDTLSWKNQEPSPYTLSKTALNNYAYSGPTATNDGTVTMQVTFTSAASFQMTHTFVSNADPGCAHVHYYSGTFQWNSP
jgi:hypothetical protein